MRLLGIQDSGFLLLLLSFCLFENSSWAQSQPSTQDKREIVREQTIYIPYEDLKKVFERDGRGVYLPYDQFEKLWKEAQQARGQSPTTQPIQSMLVSAENDASIQRDLMVVTAKLRIDLVGKGWHRIPLQLRDAAIQSAKIEGQPARIVTDPSGYALLIEREQAEAKTIALELEYAKAIAKSPGQNVVGFAAPQAPINRWNIKIPEPGVKVQIEPMMAGSQVSGSDPKITEVTAFIGAAPQVSISWVPKSESAIGMEALASVQVQQTVLVEEGLVRMNSNLTYTIDRAELRELRIDLPRSHKVINVIHPNVKRWTFEKIEQPNPNEVQTILVELFEPAKKNQELSLETELTLPNQATSSFEIQPIVCRDANRQSGFIGIRVADSLKMNSSERMGLVQADLAEAPVLWHNQKWTSIYRYSSIPYRLLCSIEKVKPSIRVTQRVEYIAEVERLNVELSTQHQIENSGVFQLEFEIPTNYELLQVKSSPSAGVGDVEIDRFEKSSTDSTRWIVHLKKRTIGAVGLWLQMRQSLSSLDLRNPTEKPIELALELPRAAGVDVQWVEGWAAVYTPESLRVTPIELTGARDTVSQDLRLKWQANCQTRFPNTTEALAFAYSMEKVSVKVGVERRKPFVTHRQWLHAFVDSGAIRYASTHFVRAQYSAITKWRLDVPQALAKEIRVESQGVRESVITPAPADLAEGYVAWELTSDVPWIGDREFRLTWQSKLDSLDIGKSTAIDVPVLIARGVDQSFGQITLHKREGIDLDNVKSMDGLRAIDPRFDLLPEINSRSAGSELSDVKQAASAFEYQGDWKLNVEATRFALQSISTTNIERAYLQATLTRSDQIAVQAAFRMKNARQRVALKLPVDAEFNSQPLRINGESASLERGTDGVFFIPMASSDPSKATLVELSYLYKGKPNSIPLPVFPDEPSIQKVYLQVAMPKEWVLLSTNRRWNDEFEWRKDGWQFVPENHLTEQALQQWVSEDTAIRISSATSGILKGTEQSFLFSSIRPGKEQDQSFESSTIDSRWLSAMILIGFVVLAIIMLHSPWRLKIAAAALVVSVLLSLGLFSPLLARQLLNYPTMVGAGIVAIFWSSQSLATWGSSIRQTALSRRVPSPATVNNSATNAPPETKESQSKEVKSEDNPKAAEDNSSEGGN